jgi:hypothetical protein
MTTAAATTAASRRGRHKEPQHGLGERSDRHPGLREIIGDSFISAFDSAMTLMGWSEEEIESMSRSHPDQADRIWHSFSLLRPTSELMGTEFVYRSHCRELLERVVAGEDTRPGTAAECCIACCETSQIAPFNTAGTGLYMRMWCKAGFPDVDFPREHYEAIKGEAIDENEQLVRKKLARGWRRLPKVIKHSPRCPASRATADPREER